VLAGKLRGVGRFKGVRRSLAAGKRRVVVLRISAKTARKLRRTVRRHRVRVTLTVKARDAAGNRRTVTRRVTVPRARR
jgi:hypothetical protein